MTQAARIKRKPRPQSSKSLMTEVTVNKRKSEIATDKLNIANLLRKKSYSWLCVNVCTPQYIHQEK